MIRILHYGITENRGGIETYLFNLYNNIDRSKFHFDFIDTTLDKPSFYDEYSAMGCNFFKVTPRKVSPVQNKKDLESLFKNNQFDILHCHINTLSYIEPIKVALKYGCKVIVHSRNAGCSNSIKTKLLHYIHYPLLPKSRIRKLAVSKKAGNWLFGNNSDFTVLNNGIETNKFMFDEEKRIEIRKDLNIEGKFVIGNVGAFIYAKNHKFILSTFNEFLNLNNNAVLLLIGMGSLQNEIEEKVKEMGLTGKVLFLGKRSDISSILSAMDFFLFPSFYEGFPNAVLEAQTSGLPCLISDTITQEVVISDKCIQMPLDLPAKDWARKILEFQSKINRKDGLKVIESAGFSVEKKVKEIEDIYLEYK